MYQSGPGCGRVRLDFCDADGMGSGLELQPKTYAPIFGMGHTRLPLFAFWIEIIHHPFVAEFLKPDPVIAFLVSAQQRQVQQHLVCGEALRLEDADAGAVYELRSPHFQEHLFG